MSNTATLSVGMNDAVITLKDAMRWDTFLDKSDVVTLFGDAKAISVNDVLASPVDTRDKLWALLRTPPLSATELHEFACWLAETDLRARNLWIETTDIRKYLRDLEIQIAQSPDGPQKEQVKDRLFLARYTQSIHYKRMWVAGQLPLQELDAIRNTISDKNRIWTSANEATRDVPQRAAWMASQWAKKFVPLEKQLDRVVEIIQEKSSKKSLRASA